MLAPSYNCRTNTGSFIHAAPPQGICFHTHNKPVVILLAAVFIRTPTRFAFRQRGNGEKFKISEVTTQLAPRNHHHRLPCPLAVWAHYLTPTTPKGDTVSVVCPVEAAFAVLLGTLVALNDAAEQLLRDAVHSSCSEHFRVIQSRNLTCQKKCTALAEGATSCMRMKGVG